jgi:hypothetical protein
MNSELINISGLVDLVIHHDRKLIELLYYRTCRVEEFPRILYAIQAHRDWHIISQYQLKAEQ